MGSSCSVFRKKTVNKHTVRSFANPLFYETDSISNADEIIFDLTSPNAVLPLNMRWVPQQAPTVVHA